MPTIELEEYQSWTGVLPPRQLDALSVLAGDRLTITRQVAGKVEIKATAHVGTLITRDLSVRIRPKVDLDNLFYMLGVGDKAWTVDRTTAPYAVVEDDVVTAVVRLFCREVNALTSRGLLHGYVAQEERLLSIRGRVDLISVMRRPWERSPVPCQFDEFIPDIWLNRVLLAALSEVRRLGELPAAVRGEVHLLTQRFEGVTPTPIDLRDIERWRPRRNEQRYVIALRLAEVILQQLSLADREGAGRAASFTINMNQLFEDFVGRELARRLPRDLALTEQYPTHLDTGTRMGIAPDFVIHPEGRPRDPLYVADAKYKMTESMGVISDHYQLLAYATVFGLNEGALIYCQRADDDIERAATSPVRSITVRAAQIEHFVYRLDLSGGRADIDVRLDALAEWLVHRIELNRHDEQYAIEPLTTGSLT
jgi:5-methylcytosine-specific restriction enzyme subunit McrC